MIRRRDLVTGFFGLLMGGADIVPGVSGGTVALILGIYERLVRAISHFDVELLRLLRRFDFKGAAAHADLRFLAVLLLGIGTGVVGLASVMHHLLEHHAERTLAAFFGMILASSLLVARMIGRRGPDTFATVAIGGAFAFWIVGLPFLDSPPEGMAYLFMCGAIAICAMILPGISGAFILLILGKYFAVTGVLAELARGRFSYEAIQVVVVFSSGALVGILSFSKLLRWLLEKRRAATMAALAGFMLGSLRRIWPFKIDVTPAEVGFELRRFENVLPDWSDGGTWATIGVVTVGFGFVLALERIAAPRTRGS